MKKLLIMALFVLNAYCVTNDTNDKFNFAGLPQEMQAEIILDAFVDSGVDKEGRFILPMELYNNLLKFRKIKPFWGIIKRILSNENLKNLYFPNNILKLKFPMPLITQALIYAVARNSLEVAELLLILGANAKVWDPKTKRPVIDCAYNQRSILNKFMRSYGRSAMEQLLLKYGATENAPYIQYETIKTILLNNDIEAIKKLINSGANINIIDGSRNTVLNYAPFFRRLEIAKELIASGADVNAKNIVGYTPLMGAAHCTYLEMVKELIMAGADVNSTDENGEKALDIARKYVHLGHDYLNIANYLEQITKK